VRQFFEANGTAYLVMDYYEGLSFAEYLEQQGGRVPEETAVQLMLPILDGLRAVHAKGFLHRDVKPQNIYLAKTDVGGVRPILLDFGAARQAMGERSRSMSVVISAGYAPLEQYSRKGKQGPWTDIYAAAAVLYQAVTGEVPPEATDRIMDDELKSATGFGVSQELGDALSAALAMAPEARPQSVQTLQKVLRRPAHGPKRRAEVPDTSAPIPARTNHSHEPRAQKHTGDSAVPPVDLIAGRYHDLGDGTVMDIRTGLQWMRCAFGQNLSKSTCQGEAQKLDWKSALAAAQSLNRSGGYAGYRDWRVPTIDELKGLRYCKGSSEDIGIWLNDEKRCEGDHFTPAIESEAFPGSPAGAFWSSSPSTSYSGNAWYVHFYCGDVYYHNKYSLDCVRLVRGGQ
ncbi:DUF1566 domain-containing protein, partial [Thiohalocapsa marina]